MHVMCSAESLHMISRRIAWEPDCRGAVKRGGGGGGLTVLIMKLKPCLLRARSDNDKKCRNVKVPMVIRSRDAIGVLSA